MRDPLFSPEDIARINAAQAELNAVLDDFNRQLSASFNNFSALLAEINKEKN